MNQIDYLSQITDLIKTGAEGQELIRKKIKQSKWILSRFKDGITPVRVLKYLIILLIGFLIVLPIMYITGEWLSLIIVYIFTIPFCLLFIIGTMKLFSRGKTGLTFEMTLRRLMIDLIWGYGTSTTLFLILAFFRSDLLLCYIFGVTSAAISTMASEYLLFNRINGAGLTFLYAILLFLDIETRPHSDIHFVEDYRGLIIGIDKWYFDTLKIRIQNHNEVLGEGCSQLATNPLDFQSKIKKLIEEYIFIPLQNYNTMDNLPKINEALSKILNLRINFNKESVATYFSRNLEKIDSLVAICGVIIGLITGIILNYLI